MKIWHHSMNAISEPWNTFITDVETLTVRGAELDKKTAEEAISWIS